MHKIKKASGVKCYNLHVLMIHLCPLHLDNTKANWTTWSPAKPHLGQTQNKCSCQSPFFCCNFLGQPNSSFKTHFPAWILEQFCATQLHFNPKTLKGLKPQGRLRPFFPHNNLLVCGASSENVWTLFHKKAMVTSSDGLGRLKSTSPLSLSGGSSR